jgi:YD repeat-containing protein
LGEVDVYGWFFLTNTFSAMIPPGAATTLTVCLDTRTNGAWTGLLTFPSNDTNNDSPFVINLTGSVNLGGTPPSVSLLSPTNNASYPFASIVPVTASASAATGSIANVQFILSNPLGRFLLGAATNPATSNQYTVNWTGLTPGPNALVALATDSAGRVSQSAPVNIQMLSPSTNPPPVAIDDHFAIPAFSSNNVLNVLTNDSSPSGGSLRIIGTLFQSSAAHGTVDIVDNGQRLCYTPPPTGGGYAEFSYEIADETGGIAWANVSINVYTPPPPSVTLTAAAYTINALATDQLVAQVAPTSGIVRVDFFLNYSCVGSVTNGINGSFVNNWVATPNDSGCTLYAVATDILGRQGASAPISIRVTNSCAGATPVATLDSFLGSSGTNSLNTGATIQDGLIQLFGRACSPGSSNVLWQLGVYSLDGTLLCNLTPSANNMPVGTSSSPASLGRCDLSALPNGKYYLDLLVFNGCQTTETNIEFTLYSNLKIGQFSFSQQDLIIPVNGIPLTVVRAYNSLNSTNRGDFGYGWTYSLCDMDVSIDETRQIAINYDGNPFSQRCGGGRDVTLTLPNGRRTTFSFSCHSAGLYSQVPVWNGPPGCNARLEAQGNPTLETMLYNGHDTSSVFWKDGGYVVPMDNFDFSGFILTTLPDDTKYFINREDLQEQDMTDWGTAGYTQHAWGNSYLAQIVQRSGDRINISSNSISHVATNNVTTHTISIQRNKSGLITAITDPIAGPSGLPAVKYEYDGNQNLMNVLTLVDRSGNGTYVTNSYVYGYGSFPHYITSIQNAGGTPVAQNFYDDQGRLTKMQDANGNVTQFIHNTANNMEVVIDRLHNTNTYVYDLHGNVTASTNALNQVTMMAYDTNNNKTIEVVFLNGHSYATNRYAYDGNNLLLSSIDPLGHSCSFAYNGYGQVTISTDARSNKTTNSYDGNGNLIGTSDALGNSTTNFYNSCSLLIGSVDPLGTRTTNSYDGLGNLIGTTTFAPDGSTVLSTGSPPLSGVKWVVCGPALPRSTFTMQ